MFTLRQCLDHAPMGLGMVAQVMLESKIPSLAEELDVPIQGLKIEFADGSTWSAAEDVPHLLDAENAQATDDRPALEGDCGCAPCTPHLAS